MGRWWHLHRRIVAAGLALAACDEEVADGVVAEPDGIVGQPADAAEPAEPTDGNAGTRPGAPREGAEPGKGRKAPAERGDPDARTPGAGRPPADGQKPPAPGARNPQARKPGAKPGQPGQPGQPRPVAPKPPGINQVSATKWTITRSLADQWMKNPYALGNVREAGEGWQLVGVRAKAAHWLGMHNGDVILEANGHKLDTRPQLLAAYLDLKNDKLFRVTFVRAGQTVVHTYQIVEGGGSGAEKGEGDGEGGEGRKGK
jgi:hypothetical protein